MSFFFLLALVYFEDHLMICVFFSCELCLVFVTAMMNTSFVLFLFVFKSVAVQYCAYQHRCSVYGGHKNFVLVPGLHNDIRPLIWYESALDHLRNCFDGSLEAIRIERLASSVWVLS